MEQKWCKVKLFNFPKDSHQQKIMVDALQRKEWKQKSLASSAQIVLKSLPFLVPFKHSEKVQTCYSVQGHLPASFITQKATLSAPNKAAAIEDTDHLRAAALSEERKPGAGVRTETGGSRTAK